MTVATDIICGFPYETKEDFEDTLKLVEKYRIPVVNISQFYPRPGTVAAKWKRVDTKEVKRRSTAMAKLFQSYPNYEHLKGTIQRVWIHDTIEDGRNIEENYMVAHTKSYAKVLIKRMPELVGKQVIVKVNDIHKWHVYADIIDINPKSIHVKFDDHFKGMYNPNKKTNNNNKLAQIRKEQIDIHATIVLPGEEKLQKNIAVENKTSNFSVSVSKNNIIGSILYICSLYFLYLGMQNYIKFNESSL